MTDLAGIITAAGSAFTIVGTGVAFVYRKFESRFRAIERKLEACEQRERDSQERRAVQLTVIELLWQEVKRRVPDSAVLERAKHLLDQLSGKQAD